MGEAGTLLERIDSPRDLEGLSSEEISSLCGEIRAFLLKNISVTGGHLASNLGVVELTVAIHRVFDTSRDRLVFDVGHQCYVHKLLTGRREAFSTLRKYGGLSGFPKPRESIHDAFTAGHASTAVSEALGMARARTLSGEDYSVLALVGDGALTGGAAYEGLNDAADSGEPLIVILNDNGMAIAPNVGGVARHLANLRLKPGYRKMKRGYRKVEDALPFLGWFFRFLRGIKNAVKRSVLHNSLFEHMGLEYLGPVDGHDEAAVEEALRLARDMACPVLVHVITKKGKGYAFAEENPDEYHGVSGFDTDSGTVPGGDDFSAVFGHVLTDLASGDPEICAVTAAMEAGTGLHRFAGAFPRRYFDVGIAEGHAVAMAAGLAKQGKRPVAAVYSTFLQRAYDMLLEDVALQGLHVVFGVDRSGLVGADGETHHGLYDKAFLSQMPGFEVWCPASYGEMRDMLSMAVEEKTGPVALCYPRGGEGTYSGRGAEPLKCLREGQDCVIVTCGVLVNEAVKATDILGAGGISAGVVKLGRVRPVDYDALLPLLRDRVVLVLEENARIGGIGERIAAKVSETGTPVRSILLRNTGDRFVGQGTREELIRECGLDGESVAQAIQKEILNGGKTT